MLSHSLFLAGVCGLPGTAGSDRYLHAWQDPHPEDFSHPDLPSSLVAEDPREHRYGLVSGGLELGMKVTESGQLARLCMGNSSVSYADELLLPCYLYVQFYQCSVGKLSNL